MTIIILFSALTSRNSKRVCLETFPMRCPRFLKFHSSDLLEIFIIYLFYRCLISMNYAHPQIPIFTIKKKMRKVVNRYFAGKIKLVRSSYGCNIIRENLYIYSHFLGGCSKNKGLWNFFETHHFITSYLFISINGFQSPYKIYPLLLFSYTVNLSRCFQHDTMRKAHFLRA